MDRRLKTMMWRLMRPKTTEWKAWAELVGHERTRGDGDVVMVVTTSVM